MRSTLVVVVAIAAFVSLAALSASAQSYAVTNARIVTGTGETIQNGTIVLRNGLIVAVGANVQPPADAMVINGTGTTVYPGFIDALTNLGMPAPPARPAGGGPAAMRQQPQAPESNSNYPDGLRAEEIAADVLKNGETQFESARNAGFTTAVTTGRTGIFTGRSAVINLAGENVSTMIVRSPYAYHMSFTTVGGGQYPASLLGTFSSVRQMVNDARRLQEMQKAYTADPRGVVRPPADKTLEALYPLVNGELPLVVNANRETEIARALDLGKELNIKLIIAGGQEAGNLAARLKEQNVPVLLSLNFPKRTAAASPEADPESLELLRFRAAAPKTAAQLAQAGVKFAFQSGGASNLADFFSNAGKAVESGLSRDAAINAMTFGSAELLGISDRAGSLESGKIANVTVVKGDLFGKDRTVTHVFVDGKMFEPKPPPARPQANGRTGAAASLPNVGGNYSITIEMTGQVINGTLAMVQQGGTLTGTFSTDVSGSAPLKDGKVTPDGFSFNATVDYAGTIVDIVVRGTVSGDNISGTIDSPQGAIAFTGTRNP